MSHPDLSATVADELEIRNIIAAIAQDSDDGTLDSYGSRFTVDACWEMPGAPARHGRADIVAAGAARRAAGETGPGSNRRHVITTVAVAVHGDQAVAQSYWLFYTNTDRTPALRSMGKYDDSFERTPTGWQLSRRTITLG